jgi:transposase
MARGDLTDGEWERLRPHLPPEQPARRGGRYRDHRQVLNGILWILRTGAPWRDLPERYGPWQTCYSRFRNWSAAGVFQRALQSLQAKADAQGQIDWRSTAVDGTYIKAHPHAAGARKGGPRPRRRRTPKGSAGAEAG